MVSCHRARTGDRASGGRVRWRHRRVHIRFPFSRRVLRRCGHLGPADSQQTRRNRGRLGPADSQQTWRNRVHLGPTPRSVGTACAHPLVTATARESPPGRERGQRSVKGGPETRVQPRPRTRRVRAPGPTSRLRPSSCSTFVSRAHAARPADSRPLPRRGSRRLASPPAVGGPGPPCEPVGPAPGSPPAWGSLCLPTRGGDRLAPTDEDGGTNFLSPRSPPEGVRGELQERTDSDRAVGSAGLGGEGKREGR